MEEQEGIEEPEGVPEPERGPEETLEIPSESEKPEKRPEETLEIPSESEVGSATTRRSKLSKMAYSTEVRSNRCLQLRRASGKILSGFYSLPHPSKDRLPIRATKHSARAKEGQRIVFSTGVVNCDVPKHVLADLLREVDVNAQEVRCREGSINN